MAAISALVLACSSSSSAPAQTTYASDATTDATDGAATAPCAPADANALLSGACTTGDRCVQSLVLTCGPGVKAIPCGGGGEWLCECVDGQWACSADAGFCLEVCDAGADADAGD